MQPSFQRGQSRKAAKTTGHFFAPSYQAGRFCCPLFRKSRSARASRRLRVNQVRSPTGTIHLFPELVARLPDLLRSRDFASSRLRVIRDLARSREGREESNDEALLVFCCKLHHQISPVNVLRCDYYYFDSRRDGACQRRDDSGRKRGSLSHETEPVALHTDLLSCSKLYPPLKDPMQKRPWARTPCWMRMILRTTSEYFAGQKGGGSGLEGGPRLCRQVAPSSDGNGAESWSRTIGGELADATLEADLYIAAFGFRIKVMSCQIKSQILCVHAGIIERRYCELQVRERGFRCADRWQRQHEHNRDETYCTYFLPGHSHF